jgi:hypothetical protein
LPSLRAGDPDGLDGFLISFRGQLCAALIRHSVCLHSRAAFGELSRQGIDAAMSPYRTPSAKPKPDEEKFLADPPYFALGLLLLAAFRIVVAIATKEPCGADVGIATLVAALAGRAVVTR